MSDSVTTAASTWRGPAASASRWRPRTPPLHSGDGQRPKARWSSQLAGHLPSFLSVGALVVVWLVLGSAVKVSFIPSVPAVAAALGSLGSSGQLYRQGIGTLVAIGIGFGIAVVAGTAVGVAMGRNRVLERLLGMYVNAGQSVPMAAVVPILALVFGLGQGSIVATVAIFAFFAIAINVHAGIRRVDPALVEMARSFGAPERVIITRVAVPAALPLVFTGLRIGIGRAVDGAILGEMLVSLVGLGGSLMTYGSSFRLSYVYALLLCIFVLGRVTMALVSLIGRAVQPWARR